MRLMESITRTQVYAGDVKRIAAALLDNPTGA
jgi:hypothetical protein